MSNTTHRRGGFKNIAPNVSAMSSGGLELLTIKIQKMIINTTTDGTGTNPAITYSECYAPLFIDRKQYEEDLQRRQKEHLDNVYGNQNRNWRPCLHDSCPDCLGTGVKRDGGMCIHGISCPCPKCTPSY